MEPIAIYGILLFLFFILGDGFYFPDIVAGARSGTAGTQTSEVLTYKKTSEVINEFTERLGLSFTEGMHSGSESFKYFKDKINKKYKNILEAKQSVTVFDISLKLKTALQGGSHTYKFEKHIASYCLKLLTNYRKNSH